MRAPPAAFIVVLFVTLFGCKENAPGVFTYHGKRVEANIVAELSSATGNSRIMTPLPAAEDEGSLHRNLTPIIRDLYVGIKPGESVIVSVEMAWPDAVFSWGGRYTVERTADGRFMMSEPDDTKDHVVESSGAKRQFVSPTQDCQTCINQTIAGIYSRWPDGFMGIANPTSRDSVR